MNKSKPLLILALIVAMCTTGLEAKVFDVNSRTQVQEIINQQSVDDDEGIFLRITTKNKKDEHFFSIGLIPDFEQYSASYRNKSCWMIPSVGEDIASVPTETQFLLIDRGQSNYLMMIPLVDNITRSCLEGTPEKGLQLIAETGDRFTKVNEFMALYILAGNNPQTMIKKASAEIQKELKTFELREKKETPWFVDYFGWCTWNALYTKLSADTLMYAVDNFKKKDIPVKYMIIDAGWQSHTNDYMDSYAADKKKFPNGLAPFISEVKENSSIERVFAWQALWGTFKGLDAEAFSHISAPVHCELPPRMQKKAQAVAEDVQQVATVGKEFYPGKAGKDIMVPDFVPYMEEYSDYLRRQGVDGIKIDAMTWVESSGNGRGGRVVAMKEMMQGVQAASNVHFNNEMINCSSCSNDYLFNSISSNVTRSSGDFFPKRPETHGSHIFTNAHTSFWMGEIVMPDWDMFQSGHISGDIHAAARAISGGPVYTTEEIGSEDKAVLDKLMTSYGRLPRCIDVGRVCTESLFTDPKDGDKAIKIYNKNRVNAVIGAFNCSYDSKKTLVVSERIKSSDIEGFEADEFVVFRGSDAKISSGQDNFNISLKELEYDIFTYVPIVNGIAPVGITEKYNPGGMITQCIQVSESTTHLDLMDGGTFLAYCETQPSEVLLDAKTITFDYNNKKKTLLVNVPVGKEISLTIIK